MKIKPFALERYFARYEFSAPYLLSCSDAEPLTLAELLNLANPQAKHLWENLSLGYTDSQGHPLLLEEIAGIYNGISPEQIVEVIPEEGIFIAMNVLLEAGDHVVVTHPGYQSLSEIARSIGCEVSWWEPNMANDMSFSIADLANLIKPSTKLIVINFPHNPTGALITHTEQQNLIDLASRNNICVFSDEMYRYSEVYPDDRLPAIIEKYEKGVSLCGLSKSFSLPGLRTGWLASHDNTFIESVKTFKDYTSICGSAPSEILALIALQAKDKILARNKVIFNHNLSILEEFFETHENFFRWVKPKGGTIIFPELLLEISADTFCQTLLHKKGIMLLSASIIGYAGNHVRIGFGRRNMPVALNHLTDYLGTL